MLVVASQVQFVLVPVRTHTCQDMNPQTRSTRAAQNMTVTSDSKKKGWLYWLHLSAADLLISSSHAKLGPYVFVCSLWV